MDRITVNNFSNLLASQLNDEIEIERAVAKFGTRSDYKAVETLGTSDYKCQET
jgi:hypothetical protein